jgi:DNA-binding beta-propeller fold protein YncE
MGQAAVAVAALALAAALLAACGGSSSGLAPAAEPARSPPLDREPAGRVVPVGHKLEGLAFDPGTGLLAVGLTDPDRLALVDGDTGRVVRRVRLSESPRQALSVVEHGRRIEALPAPRQPGGVATTTDRQHVGVVGVRERALKVFDARTLKSTGKLSVGIGPTHVAGAGERFFVVDTRGNALLEVRLDPLRVHRRTHLGGAPYGIALDPERRRYWVTLTARNQVAELTDRRVLRRFPTVRQPNSVAVDPFTGRVFVASRKSGTLQFFNPPACKGEECDR